MSSSKEDWPVATPYYIRGIAGISLPGVLMSGSIFLFVFNSEGCIISNKLPLLGVAENCAEHKCKQVPADSSKGVVAAV